MTSRWLFSPPKALKRHEDVVCCLPTGSGKTAVAISAAWYTLSTAKRLVYTSPLKALSAQKRREFSEIFGEDAVGLAAIPQPASRCGKLVRSCTEPKLYIYNINI